MSKKTEFDKVPLRKGNLIYVTDQSFNIRSFKYENKTNDNTKALNYINKKYTAKVLNINNDTGEVLVESKMGQNQTLQIRTVKKMRDYYKTLNDNINKTSTLDKIISEKGTYYKLDTQNRQFINYHTCIYVPERGVESYYLVGNEIYMVKYGDKWKRKLKHGREVTLKMFARAFLVQNIIKSNNGMYYLDTPNNYIQRYTHGMNKSDANVQIERIFSYWWNEFFNELKSKNKYYFIKNDKIYIYDLNRTNMVCLPMLVDILQNSMSAYLCEFIDKNNYRDISGKKLKVPKKSKLCAKSDIDKIKSFYSNCIFDYANGSMVENRTLAL